MEEPTFTLKYFKEWLKNNESTAIKIVPDENDIVNEKNRLQTGEHVYIRLSESKINKNIQEINFYDKKEQESIKKSIVENGCLIKKINGSNAIVKLLKEDKEICLTVPKLFLRRFNKKNN